MTDGFNGDFDDVVDRDSGVFIARSRGRAPEEDDEGRDLYLGEDRDPDLWSAQRPLLEEDEREGIDLSGFDDEEARRVMEALGDEAAEPFPDAPEGVSATGNPFTPEHGGFPADGS